MKTIGLMLPYDFKLFSVASVLDVFETLNGLYHTKSKELPFKLILVQSGPQMLLNGKSFLGYPILSIRSNLKLDMVIIPSFTTPDLDDTIEKNKMYVPWLSRQFNAGVEIASLCTGAFLFASSGLLDGRLATTHMDVCAKFIVDFPLVFTKPGRTVTVDHRCYTSGGSTSSFHLLIFLIQKYCGIADAVRISKIFAIDLDRHHQSYFSTFRPDYSHFDELIKSIQKKN